MYRIEVNTSKYTKIWSFYIMNFLKKLVESLTTQVPSNSEAGKISGTDWVKVVRDTSLVAGSAAVAYLLEQLPSMNFGEKQAMLVPIVSFVLTFAMRFLRDNSTTK